jgi:hypothetical protein
MLATPFRILDNGSRLDHLSLVATPETSFVVIAKDGRLHENLPESQSLAGAADPCSHGNCTSTADASLQSRVGPQPFHGQVDEAADLGWSVTTLAMNHMDR